MSINHLKMGLIRCGYTALTPGDGEQLTAYLWPILREMVKTAIENGQDLTLEGCYIPFDWEKDFTDEYRRQIRYVCLVMSEGYIRQHFDRIREFANVVERRQDDSGCTMEWLLRSNARALALAKRHRVDYLLIDGSYDVDVALRLGDADREQRI